MEEFDIIETLKSLLQQKKRLIRYMLIGFAAGVVIAFSIPKEYKSSVVLVPETSSSSSLGGLSSLASMAGVDISSIAGGGGGDAFSFQIYPEVISSQPFLVELFDFPVVDEKINLNTDLFTYLEDDVKSPWWGYISKGLGGAIKWSISLLKGGEPEEDKSNRIVSDYLTRYQLKKTEQIKKMIDVQVNKKSNLITISTISQNAKLSADLADSVRINLQTYITRYRTQKARRDLEYITDLCDDARSKYIEAQIAYARFSDTNQDLFLHQYKNESNRLENEMQLAYNVYAQLSQQKQIARSKVQDRTPSFTLVQPATVAYKATKPQKILIAMMFVFFAFLLGSIKILLEKRKRDCNVDSEV